MDYCLVVTFHTTTNLEMENQIEYYLSSNIKCHRRTFFHKTNIDAGKRANELHYILMRIQLVHIIGTRWQHPLADTFCGGFDTLMC